ncbi:penicillin-binding protein 2 [Candidatus Falkowbacteria bacterium]|jgi:penicillin-binding protein 2|nr:penicillin-binding protein 2 [Candidatus Falkowbacteria bacterium]MBT5503509.1 penicillin-binding protein 2 [Candidatus Falkowbacteria bacterium]MBT6573981.1 penicillin-binding protein 2 [Candidatus Falkowbacteria bacterium]MBT7348200.1 penicillin-binding protein 2 [Candidatus Falkowbacteria bacterium]MBT7500179.1 penicillin-binding protein 2 [Candidatus Falkowbacteria bacterium]
MRWRLFFRKKHNKSNLPEDGFLFLGGGLNINDENSKKRKRTAWVEEAYIDFSEDELARTGKNYLGLSLSNKKLVWFLMFVLACFFILFLQSFFLQVVRGEYYHGLAEQNRLRVINLPAPRGIIYDLNGQELVKNVPNFAVYIIMYDLKLETDKNQEETLTWLKQNIEDPDYQEKLEKVLKTKATVKEYFEPVMLIDGLTYEKAVTMRIQSTNHPGVDIEVAARRQYLDKKNNQSVSSLAHILGYPGKINPEEFSKLYSQGYLLNDSIGKTGIEGSFENQLRGQYGREQIEVDSSGKAIKIIAREEMVKGDNLFLAIDLTMQAKLQEIIEKYLVKLKTNKAAAVVMNPQTGKIYSLLSLPGFNNNSFAEGISSKEFAYLINNKDNPLFNRVISGEYPSGSTIKPVVAAGALEEGVINENTSFLSAGGIRIGEWFFPDWKAGGHGITNVRKALADSVNTFFYIIGGGYGEFEGMGVRQIKQVAEMFGLNKLTNISLPNEKPGFLPDPEWKRKAKSEQWYIGDTYHMAIGQGDLLVTPLQVANFTAVFANGGKLLKPILIDRYYDQVAKKEVQIETEILNEQFVADKTLQIIRQGLRQAVTQGSAKILNSLPVTAAAKTGTAQWATDKTPHSWFTSFAPYNDAEIVVTILVEEGGEGSAIAAPIAYEFMHWYFNYYK